MIDLISLMFLVSGTILLTITLIVLIVLIRKYWGEMRGNNEWRRKRTMVIWRIQIYK